ncbi:MAG: hypothetical protein FWD38_01775 [Oscillospiraceae bacterium]|nr:hypothetical protein [Oscillospiraceae bacterium]
MPVILSIDQGGTKTDVLIADDKGNILGYGNDRDWKQIPGERRNIRMVRIRHAADKAIDEAGLSYPDISNVSACCTGADWDFEYELGRKNIRETLGINNVELYNDCIGALRGGTTIINNDCAVLCLGSGANCAVFNKEGRMHTFHYYLKGEHQGADAIGNFIFQAVLDAQAKLGGKTVLTDLLLEETGYKNVDELFMMITTGRSEHEEPIYPVYKDYAHLLFHAIEQNDAISLSYLDWLCKELVKYVEIGVNELSIGQRNLDVVLSGGVPKSGDIMRERLHFYLTQALPNAVLIDAKLEPVVGALLLGYDRVYPDGIPKNITETLEQNCIDRKLLREQR